MIACWDCLFRMGLLLLLADDGEGGRSPQRDLSSEPMINKPRLIDSILLVEIHSMFGKPLLIGEACFRDDGILLLLVPLLPYYSIRKKRMYYKERGSKNRRTDRKCYNKQPLPAAHVHVHVHVY